jgi:hypothetical protein
MRPRHRSRLQRALRQLYPLWELPDGTSFKFSAAERKVVLDAYKQLLEMFYNRLHALGLVFNPLLHSKHKFDGTCMVETRQYIDAYFLSESDKAARCHQQLDNFRDKRGEFHRDCAMWSTYLHGQHRLSPISWWRRFALMSGDLLEIAECCLPMPTSIGSSELAFVESVLMDSEQEAQSF